MKTPSSSFAAQANPATGKRFLLISGFAESIMRFRGHLIQDLLSAGFEVHVVAPGFGGCRDVRERLEQMGAVVHDISLQRTGKNPLADLLTIWNLFRLIRAIKPEAVLAYMIKPVVFGLSVARLARVPRRYALITGLGTPFQEGKHRSLFSRVIQQFYRVALTDVDRVFFQNPDDQALFRRLGVIGSGVPSVLVSGSGVDISEYAFVPAPAEVSFLLIARLLADKGIREYAAAAQRLRAKFPSMRCRLVGWIDDHPNSIQAEELDGWVSSGAIEYLGKLADVRPALAGCSVYVLPSFYREGIPRSVLEALSMGRAVITTDAPGCRETVRQGENGFLVVPRSVDALVAAMEKFLLDPKLASVMGTKSRKFAEERFDVQAVNRVMLSEMNIAR